MLHQKLIKPVSAQLYVLPVIRDYTDFEEIFKFGIREQMSRRFNGNVFYDRIALYKKDEKYILLHIV